MLERAPDGRTQRLRYGRRERVADLPVACGLAAAEPPAPVVLPALQPGHHLAGQPRPQRRRGFGPSVPRGFVTVITPQKATIPSSHSGRLELANWFASKQNPLTARVAVNRIWHHLFGVGLVPTTDNFGAMSELPSHPELLDTLAVQFMEDGWSVKKMIRRIMLTHAYQLGSQHDSANYETDPENRYLWRMGRHRLEAEAILADVQVLEDSAVLLGDDETAILEDQWRLHSPR